MKRIAALLLFFVMGALPAGCQGDGTGEKTTSATFKSMTTQQTGKGYRQYGDTGGLRIPVVDKPVTVSWMLSSDVLNLNDKPVIKEIEKRTGVKVDVQAVPSASYEDKVRMVLASGKLPDITEGIPYGELNTLGAQGVFVAINKYADVLPNFQRLYMQENTWVMKSYADDQGNIYIWPVYQLSRDVNHGFLYRKDIFDKYGIKEWDNTDEFYQALKKLKGIFPDSFPYASKTQQYIFRDWSYGWGLGNDSFFPMYFDERTEKWKLATIQPEFKEMIDFMKKLYKEGLLDPEFITDTQASWTSKMTSEDRAFVTYDWIGRLDMFYNQAREKIPGYDLRYGNPIGPTGRIESFNKILNFGTAVANNNRKEAALKMMDYLTSPSGAELITLGIKDEEFIFDSSGKVVYPELKDLPKVDISTLTNKFGCWLESMYLNVDKRSVYFNYSEKEQEAQYKILKGNKLEPVDPILRFTDDESATIAELQAVLGKAGIEFAAKYVMDGSYGDVQWNEWLEKADKLEVGRLEDDYNTAQKRYDDIR